MSRVVKRIGSPARRDRGGVATIIAVLLAGGVLLGMTALVVDVGRFYMEREELQSGADAAAYDIAMECIKNGTACVDDHDVLHNLAKGYANKNAKDQFSEILSVCGFAPNAGTSANRLPNCGPPPTDNLTNCIGTVPAGVKYVEVRTMTQVPDGDTVLPASFAGALVPGYEGTTVGACARVGWGPPAKGVAFTFSLCEWNRYVPKDADGNPILAPPGTTDPSYEHAIMLHDPIDEETPTCPAGPSGADLPGGFGWTDEDGGPCQVAVDSAGEYGAETGVPPSNDCKAALIDAYNSGEPQPVPIFQATAGSGTGGVYTLKGFAGFVITGYKLPKVSPDQPARLHGTHLCGGPDFCIYGYFTAYIESGGDIGTGEDMGATVIKTVG